MDRTTAAARATRAAEAKGHALGEWQSWECSTHDEQYAMCTRCPHGVYVDYDGHVGDEPTYMPGGNATLYPCRPSGKRGTLTHNAED